MKPLPTHDISSLSLNTYFSCSEERTALKLTRARNEGLALRARVNLQCFFVSRIMSNSWGSHRTQTAKLATFHVVRSNPYVVPFQCGPSPMLFRSNAVKFFFCGVSPSFSTLHVACPFRRPPRKLLLMLVFTFSVPFHACRQRFGSQYVLHELGCVSRCRPAIFPAVLRAPQTHALKL
jgi:hypothetical protein